MNPSKHASKNLFIPLSKETVHSLYALSEKSLVTAIVFSVLTTFALYSQLGSEVLLWCLGVMLLTLFRLFAALRFKHNPSRYTLKTWQVLFVTFALLTGLGFSSLGFLLMYGLSHYYQLFVLAALLGLTAGASISLSSDFRVAIVYISIIILPLVLSFTLQDHALGIVIPITLLLFYFSQIVMILKSYAQETTIHALVQDNKDLLAENKQFIADMVHQIRTPLTVIIANTSLIEMKSDAKIDKHIKQINASIFMLNNAYEDLSYLISHDSMHYPLKNINLSQQLQERIDFFKEMLASGQHHIHHAIDPNLMLCMNDTELERLIDNNISNALKHSVKQSDINITLSKQDEMLYLSFCSKGAAIKEPVKIFEKNVTHNPSVKRSLGLGLYMVKNICDKNNITYHVESKEGHNTFVFCFSKKSSLNTVSLLNDTLG